MRARWLAAARTDVREIARWIARARSVAAKEVARRIRDTAQTPGQNPGLSRAGAVLDTRERVIPGLPYIIIYRVRDVVEIVWVVDARRDWPANFDLAERLGGDPES